MRKLAKEVAAGAGLAIAALALLSGVDFSFFLLPLSMLALGALVLQGRGSLSPRFNVNAVGTGDNSSIPKVTFDIGKRWPNGSSWRPWRF